jgi:hypothetical protein
VFQDFIQILNKYYKSPLIEMHELENNNIRTWRELSHPDKQVSPARPAAAARPLTSLADAVYAAPHRP